MTVILRIDGEPGRRPRNIELPADGVTSFGRGSLDQAVDVVVSDRKEVSRLVGEVRVIDNYWSLTNHSRQTLVVSSIDDCGAFLRVEPGRAAVPVPFELAGVSWPCRQGELQLFEAFAMDSRYTGAAGPPADDGGETTATFRMSEGSKHFLVLVALCEPQFRERDPLTAPSVTEVIERLQGTSAYANGGTSEHGVNSQIEYLAVKFRLRDPEASETVRRDDQKRLRIISFALRYGLVRYEHLALLDPVAVPVR
jgi:hypothetical protein